MVRLLENGPFVDLQALGRVSGVIVLGLIGSGLAVCMFGAFIYDIGRAFSFW